MSRANRELVNEIIANDFAMNRRNYQYFFFKITKEEYANLLSVTVEMEVQSGQGLVEVNGYRRRHEEMPAGVRTEMLNGRKRANRVGSGLQTVTFPAEQLEKGENILAYKGQVEILSVTVNGGTGETADHTRECRGKGIEEKADRKSHTAQTDDYADALEFLLDSGIPDRGDAGFGGSNYCIYDYTNSCYRMPCWLWSDAPIVSALLHTIKSGKYPERHKEMEERAKAICEVFLRTQILDEKEETYGAYVSRYRYYHRAERAFHCLLGPNDTSFSIKWAILPMYEYTGEMRYLHSAEKGLAWVERVIRTKDFVPSHYYFEDKRWEDCAFVDTGFCVEGFQKYDEVTGGRRYQDLIDFTMKRYMRQFRLESGFYGQNYIPGRGVDSNLFSRGQGWAMEGLLACIREGADRTYYIEESLSLAALLIENQNEDGSWSWSLGDGTPDGERKRDTGSCEKGTAVIAYLLMELYRISGREECRESAGRAIAWCSSHIRTDTEEGYGGIASCSINSGITGLPFLTAATGYGNAFYLLARRLLELCEKTGRSPDWLKK